MDNNDAQKIDTGSMQHRISILAGVLEIALPPVSSAGRLAGHLDDDLHADLVGHLADHIDAVGHGLTEILGDPHALVAPDAVATDVTRDGAPKLTSSGGGAR
jgi:hypothetical protein